MTAPLTPDSLRAAIDAALAETPQHEASVVAAQDKLRRHLARIEKMRELSALYEPEEFGPFIQPSLAVVVAAGAERRHTDFGAHQQGTSRPASKKAQIDAAIGEMLAMRGIVHRSEILAEMTRRKLMGHEKDPMAALAAFLSNSRDKYAPDGRGNFSLRSPAPTELPPALDSVGSAEAGEPGVQAPGPSSTDLDSERRHVSWAGSPATE
jgi:hypothetical protein